MQQVDENKTYFKTMCSHSDKNKCGCLQFMNLHTLKRITVRDLHVHGPNNMMMQRLSGVQGESKGGGRTVKNSDATIADTKLNLAAKREEDGEKGTSAASLVEAFPQLNKRMVTRPSSPELVSPQTGRKRPADTQEAQGSDVND